MRRSLAIAVLSLVAVFVTGCNRERERFREAAQLTGGGDAAAGKVAIRQYGCHGCHTIPGVSGANGVVGPPLMNISHRVFIAGKLPNTADNLMKWIQKPQEILPGNAMPDMNISDQDSRNIAAYLYSIK